MKLHPAILGTIVSTCAMGQGFGVSLGLSVAKPRSLEGTTFSNQIGGYLGGSYRWKELTFGAGYKTPGKSTITYSGAESNDEFKWSYSEAFLHYGLPFRGESVTQRFIIGGASRYETTKAEDQAMGFSASDSRNRFWWRAGYEVEGEVEQVFTSFGVFYSGTSKDSYDPSKSYSPQEALRIFAPTSEIQVLLTFRF